MLLLLAHRPLISIATLMVTLGVIGCSGARMGTVDFSYTAPPEQAIPETYRSIAYHFTGDGFDRTYTKTTQVVPGLTWTGDDEAADLVIDVSVGDALYREEHIDEHVDVHIVDGREISHSSYDGCAELRSPYAVSIYDAPRNVYLYRQESTLVTPLQCRGHGSRHRAAEALRHQAEHQLPQHRLDTGIQVKMLVAEVIARQLLVHQVSEELRVPESHKDEPRIAEAWELLCRPSLEHVNRALAIYHAIGTDNRTAEGAVHEDLNKTVSAGIQACRHILDRLGSTPAP